jgi:hypothetical protein
VVSKERKAELNRLYRQRNRERLRAYQREWVAKNHARKLAYQAKFRDKNKPSSKPQSKEYARAYRAKNRERLRLKAREYRRKNGEKVRAYHREWQRKAYRANKARRSAARKATYRKWYATHKNEYNRKRRAAYEGRNSGEVVIPETTIRMEVEQEMVLARLEGRNPEEARRQWFAKEKGWERATKPLVTPYEDGPFYVPFRDRRSA